MSSRYLGEWAIIILTAKRVQIFHNLSMMNCMGIINEVWWQHLVLYSATIICHGKASYGYGVLAVF
jgi:hypothetical protein